MTDKTAMAIGVGALSLTVGYLFAFTVLLY